MPAARPAFVADSLAVRARAAAKAAWWNAGGAAVRALARPDRDAAPADGEVTAPPPPKARVRRAYLAAFRKDAQDVAAGLYPPSETGAAHPARSVERLVDLLSDAREVDARRRRGDGVEVRAEAAGEGLPPYYRQNFHYQSGGWLTRESARRYEAQVEALFAGAAGPMRRRALSLLARAWRGEDQRGRRIVDVACGSGAFLVDLRAAFPRAQVSGLDLSGPYAEEARRRSGAQVVQAFAERLPFADASLDAITCVYLFHELPPKVRRAVAGEFARVLKPAGVLAFADSVQASDEPELARMLQAFPAYFHEPFFRSFQAEDLDALFGSAGLAPEASDAAFLTKARLLRKPAG